MYGNNYINPYGYGNAPYNYTPNYNSYTPPAQNTLSQTPNNLNTNTNKIFVNGIEDVKSMRLPANSDYAFLDNDKPILYQKVVDSKGQFEVTVYDIVPHKEEQAPASEYVLKTEFDKLTSELAALKEQIAKLGGVKNESTES